MIPGELYMDRDGNVYVYDTCGRFVRLSDGDANYVQLYREARIALYRLPTGSIVTLTQE